MVTDATTHRSRTTAVRDAVLLRFRRALEQVYGDRLDRVVLFGFRARGDARADSDYDVAVFLKMMPDRRAEMNLLAGLRVQFLDAGDPFFEAMPFASSEYLERTPLMHEIRLDGVDVYAVGSDAFTFVEEAADGIETARLFVEQKSVLID